VRVGRGVLEPSHEERDRGQPEPVRITSKSSVSLAVERASSVAPLLGTSISSTPATSPTCQSRFLLHGDSLWHDTHCGRILSATA
jgi:hypothetical protein